MRFLPIILCLGFAIPSVGWAAMLPMTPKDLALMVRTGAPKDEILQELTKRRLALPLSAAGEAILVESGASAAFIAEVKVGNFFLSAVQAEAAIQAEAARAASALQASAGATAERPTTTPNSPAAQSLPAGASMQGQLEGKLVKLTGGVVKNFESKELSPIKFYVIYQSAHWSGPCRAFTPKLVDFYRKMKPQHPEFEVIFASCDRDEASMTSYMNSEKMPWPALRYDGRALLNKYCGSGIPWLVVVDADGRPLTKNGIDKQYIAPDKILALLESEYLH